MSRTLASGLTIDRRLEALLLRRTAANARFFDMEADRIARLCHRMAERFARGGRLIALGRSPQARSDARHVAVEFVHPVIVGKRALPAIALAPEGGPLRRQLELVAEPDDIAIAFGSETDDDAETGEALAAARARGCLTIAFPDRRADWSFDPLAGRDRFIRQELTETLYHVLWELVHVFFEHRGLLAGRETGTTHDPGASAFLYPFLAEGEDDLVRVLDDVRRSVLMKADDIGALRERTLTEGREPIAAAARTLRSRFEAGGQLLAFGNGGSATDAMDAVADFRAPAAGGPGRRALDLTEDASILTAIGNDIGTDAIFARQVIAYARDRDVVLAFSTSGNSRNVIEALREARRRGVRSIAIVGYGGGRVLEEGLADHVIVAPSDHIPRIQEAQASVYHVLREMVERVGPEGG
ncbi:MAG: SIS domain-containing protein [Gemmatimonadota bacterium]